MYLCESLHSKEGERGIRLIPGKSMQPQTRTQSAQSALLLKEIYKIKDVSRTEVF